MRRTQIDACVLHDMDDGHSIGVSIALPCTRHGGGVLPQKLRGRHQTEKSLPAKPGTTS